MKMSIIILTLIFISLHKIVIAQDVNKQKIDFSSVEIFWELADKIKNEKVTDTDWENLFSTGYYKFYDKWGAREYYKKTLLRALSPKMKLERDSLIKLNNFYTYTLQQIISTESDKVHFQKFQKTLVVSDIQKDILKRVKEFLPSDFNPKDMVEPNIYVGVFQPDANASNTSIVIDLKLYFDLADPIGILAHEYHHFLTLNYRKKFKESKNDSISSLMKSISQLQLEGIADMIDKDNFLASNGVGFPTILIENYRKAYANPLPSLKKMDSLLLVISKDPLSTKQNSNTILNLLPLGAHPHGFFMAKTILKIYGKDALLNTVKNPFNFISVFNTAYFEQNGKTVFSKESMEFLAHVESTQSL